MPTKRRPLRREKQPRLSERLISDYRKLCELLVLDDLHPDDPRCKAGGSIQRMGFRVFNGLNLKPWTPMAESDQLYRELHEAAKLPAPLVKKQLADGRKVCPVSSDGDRT